MILLSILFANVWVRQRAGGQEIVPLEVIWDEFLESPEYELIVAMVENDSIGELSNDKALKIWMAAIENVSYMWKALVYDNPYHVDSSGMILEKTLSKDDKEMWNTICFLVKGAFYLSNGISLSKLKQERSDRFLMHAAAGILPRFQQRGTHRSRFRIVWERILSLHGDQAAQEGPVLKRFPLHIIAATKCTPPCTPETDLVDPTKDNCARLRLDTFDGIMEVSPHSVFAVEDAEGNCPFHLACASGYSWTGVLETLFRAAPWPAISSRSLVLRAETTATAPNSKKRIRGKWWKSKLKLRSEKKARWGPEKNEVASKKEADELNTVYQLLQADPNIVMSSLLAN
ncbi:expressed unknown protein [Seminavis robusta]|uniref:Uncharacterized protein n=1 Tax=Seminavis robusta TaxID=568900 RepID=A0A9N8HHE6_9STRA|nr:expressed unknown protein [Seminavis robusta]|eukprot:Sro444_g144320.1 n/a (344) ;mRNA; r:32394-33425